MDSSVLHTEKLCKTFSNSGVQQHVKKILPRKYIRGILP